MAAECSRCKKEAKHSVLIRRDEVAPPPDKKDIRGMEVIRFCDDHWPGVEAILRPTT